ncbi:autotransporter outer membrane beta-barrel domain-containing protein [Bradyrhizobium sp. AZCC 2230]|uniref:autotransporter outer membrane beta-barrel domain-containing protein n=1 Tax=Bradyrhizobium sp. AZCC 2230 TaxID=3117021 RepID=UPI002FF3822D
MARAQSVWNGASTNYNLNTNWSPTTAPVATGQSAVFGATGSSTVTVTAGPITPDAWTFNSSSQNYTISGAAVNFGVAGVTGGIINNAGAGKTITIADNIGESVAGVQLQQLGAGSLFLSGTNTYAGPTTVSGGILGISIGGSITSNVTNSAIFDNSGTVTGSLTNTGTVNAGGLPATTAMFNGAIVNTDTAAFTVNRNVVANGSFANSGTALLDIQIASQLSGITTLTNSSTRGIGIFIDVLASLSADHVVNAAGSTIDNNGTLTSLHGPVINAGTLNTDGRDSPGGSGQLYGGINNTGTVSAKGSVSGAIVNAGSGQFFATSLNGDSSFLNQDSAQLIVSVYHSQGKGFQNLTSLTNTSTAAVGVNVTAGSALSINGALTNSGNIRINGSVVAGGVDNQAGGSIFANGPVSGNLSNAGAVENIALWSGTVANTGTFQNDAVGQVSGLLTNTAGTTINNGALNDGASISGGVFTGAGSVTNLTVSGGTFAPGNGTPGSSMTVTGSLAFQSGALYLVQVNPLTASYAYVAGTATLNGATVNAVFAPGSYVEKQYRILTATSGVSGTFGTLVNTNLPANFKTDLSYDSTNAYLNLSLISGTGLSGNQQAVSNAFTTYFNTNGGIPLIYATLTPAGLTQASGELGTGSQQTTFNAMGQFTGLLTDPFMDRGGGANPNLNAPGFADEDALGYATKDRRLASERDAYAIFTKAPLRGGYQPRWSVWAAGFGGSQSTSGNAVAGSNNTASSIYGTAVGADYLFSPQTIAGFALAGGGTNFGVTGFGAGHTDLFQAGAYLRQVNGPSYISAALAYGWQDVTTNRTVTIAGFDQLRAEFNANAWSGRLEGGYRFVAPWIGGIGITPYAAGQVTTFDLPAYAESVVSGGGAFALAYGAKSVTDSRTELGFRSDKSFAASDGIITLRGRLAWAHDFNPDRAVGATFQALPGTSFIINGAAQAADSALVTASAEKRWLNGWSAAATFEGEFSDVTRSYAGKGVVRYAW